MIRRRLINLDPFCLSEEEYMSPENLNLRQFEQTIYEPKGRIIESNYINLSDHLSLTKQFTDPYRVPFTFWVVRIDKWSAHIEKIVNKDNESTYLRVLGTNMVATRDFTEFLRGCTTELVDPNDGEYVIK